MKCIITGGAGFVGKQLARRILEIGTLRTSRGVVREVEQVVLSDMNALSPEELITAGLDDPRVLSIADDIRDLRGLDEHLGARWDSSASPVSVFHLSSVMSGQGEEDFDLCMGVNVDGIRRLVDVFRVRGVVPTFVSASSIAALPAQPVVGDNDKLSSATTYGMTKGFTEMFINDCSRKGFIDGRSARLPTIVPRPGAPNKAATGAFSSIIREPLHGRSFTCPIAMDRPHPVSGYRTLVEQLIALHEVPASTLLDSVTSATGERLAPPGDRCVQLHATSVTLDDLLSATKKAAARHGIELAQVCVELDPKLDAIVESMAPLGVSSPRAEILGLPNNPDLTTIVEEYIADFIHSQDAADLR